MKKFILTVIVLLFAGLQIADAQKKWNEIDFPAINNFEMPEVEILELDNGIKFYLVEDRELPLINLNVRVRTGSFLEPDSKIGLASMTGTVMRTGGSEMYPADDLNELLENRAARMETGIGMTSGSASMNVLKEDFEELLPVFIDLMQNPLFPEDKIELAKTQSKSAISRRNDDQAPIASREFRKLIYGEGSVYARHTEYETIDNITQEDMVEFHNRSFVGNNMLIGVIGDFEMDEMKSTLRRVFSELPAGETIEIDLPEINYAFENSINFVDKQDVNQSYVLLGHIGGMRDNPDYAKLQVMNQVLSGGFSSRLFQVVRSDMGLAYSVFGSYGSGTFYPGTFTAGVMTASETTAEAIDAIIGQIERLQNEPVSEEELQQTKDQFLNSLVFRYDSRSKILNERLNYDYAGLPEDTFDRLVEEIREVTTEDVMEVAQEYLRPSDVQILVVGNSQEIGDQLSKYGTVNEIDITIPEPADDREVVEGDAEMGREWLERMATAILPNGSFDADLTFEADNIVQTPGGEMSIGIEQTLNFQEERITSIVNAPMGQVTIEIADGQGRMLAGGNEMPMPPQQLQQSKAELYRNYVYLAINKDQLDVEFLGMKELDGEEYAHLRINDELPLEIYLDTETALPAQTEYRQMDPQQGRRISVTVEYGDWQEQSGVLMAYETISYSDGNQVSRTVISSHSVN
ncbi:M16 family metallopeptidase [Rhodohalobacter halophilus]|uniref:M16 family metallopeptidase n=1 Tax=Rhodohalobacter halophilus TaxID=1812810 RepID=UPI00083F5428|nr:pitrilysin family protein [Rhodohalobacter halophilus]